MACHTMSSNSLRRGHAECLAHALLRGAARLQAVGMWQNWCCASKEWDKKQFDYAIFFYDGPITANQAASLPASSSSAAAVPSWVPSDKLFTRPDYCESDKLLEVNRRYTTYPQHPCTYLAGWTPPPTWHATLAAITKRMAAHMAGPWQDPGVLPQV
jgi:hypothetical protein